MLILLGLGEKRNLPWRCVPASLQRLLICSLSGIWDGSGVPNIIIPRYPSFAYEELQPGRYSGLVDTSRELGRKEGRGFRVVLANVVLEPAVQCCRSLLR